MKKLNVKLVLVGHLRNTLDLQKLKQFKSRFFAVSDITRIERLPKPENDDGYLDIVYSRSEVTSLLESVDASDLVLGIMNYPFEDNFYLHRTGQNKACISISGIDQILLAHNISVENFILKNIFELVAFKNIGGKLDTDDLYDFVHQDTRGCLFDLNGDKWDVLHNTEQPIICASCREKISSKNVADNFIQYLDEELYQIRKPLICRIELFIKRYPLLSLLAAFSFAILTNIVSNIIWMAMHK